MEVLGIIPARGGSKGIHGKNIKLLGGQPLIKYTMDSALISKKLTRVILSSEDLPIIETARKIGIDVPFIRPKEISRDDTPSIEVIKHALNFFSDQDENYDAICLLQPTTPFRNDKLIDEAIQKFIEGNYDSLISVREIPSEYNPHWAFENHEGTLKIATGENDPITRRQELPKAYHRDGAIYLTKVEVLLNSNSLLGDKTGFINTTGERYVNLDTPEDWKRAEEILKYNS